MDGKDTAAYDVAGVYSEINDGYQVGFQKDVSLPETYPW